MYRTYIFIEVVDNAIIDGQRHGEKKTNQGYLALGSSRSYLLKLILFIQTRSLKLYLFIGKNNDCLQNWKRIKPPISVT